MTVLFIPSLFSLVLTYSRHDPCCLSGVLEPPWDAVVHLPVALPAAGHHVGHEVLHGEGLEVDDEGDAVREKLEKAATAAGAAADGKLQSERENRR